MADRLVEVRDGLATAIAARIGDETITVESTWDFTLNREESPTLPGRMLYVMALGDREIGPASRGDDLREYEIRVYVIEAYPDGGRIPDAWVAERLQWVTDYVMWHGNQRRDELLGSLSPERCYRTVACDPWALREQKLFWSEVDFAFREISAPAA